VPVINPGLVAIRTCEMLLDLDLGHSRLAYPAPSAPDDALFAGIRPRFGSLPTRGNAG
jgi:allantoin racemase